MGEWSEAVEDGVICQRCHCVIGDADLLLGRPLLCENCKQAEEEGKGKPGPNWLPPDKPVTPIPESYGNPAGDWP